MLECITIDNFALIDHAEIEFSKGFNILTGETGAGKSLLVGSLNMLLGERMSKDWIRYGEKRAVVQGLFRIGEPKLLQYLEDNGLEAEEDKSLILSREISSDGKNICRVSGRMVPVAKLRELGRWLINLHGQHDNQALLDRSTHCGFLDRFAKAKIQPILTEYHKEYQKLVEIKKELSGLEIDEAEKLRRMDLLQYEIKELETADLKPGEEEELKTKCSIASNAKKLLSSAGQALDVLYDNPEGECAYNFLASASQLLGSAAAIDPAFSGSADNLEEILAALEETVRQVQTYLDGFDWDEAEVELMQERLDDIYRLKRKYGGSVEAALAHLEQITKEYNAMEFMEDRRRQLDKERETCLKNAKQLAMQLTDLRKQTAGKLSAQIGESLEFLNMPDTTFVPVIEPAELGDDGADSVEFLLSANKGEPPKPLAKIVSGGELSRIMLAIESILFEEDLVDTLIFDEVDTGVSGRAAHRLGEKLSSLSESKQVICVTHLAQVAALANCHFLIEKKEEQEKTHTVIVKLDQAGKIRELARIIGGEHITDTTLKQAEEMLHG